MLAFQHAILSRNQPGFSRAFRLGTPAAQNAAPFRDLDDDVGPPSGSTGCLEVE